MTYEQQVKVDEILDKFRDNPSNSNKYRHELYAYIDDLLGNENE